MGFVERKYCLIYTNFKTANLAQALIDKLFERKMIFCAQLQSSMTSIYFWKGQRCQESEIPVFFKTRMDFKENVMSLIESEHSYDCPFIGVLELQDINQKYRQWADQQLS